AVACSASIEPIGDPVGPDAGTGGGGGGGSTSDGGSVITTPDGGTTNGLQCKNLVTAGLVSGHHNPGQDCQQGCHNHGFTLSGTLYTAGGATLAGGTVTVKDAMGTTFDVVSQLNGNFYTANAVVFPVSVYASDCPAATRMVGTIPAGSGGC